MNKYIGIDLGGTNVRVALVTSQGEILKENIKPSLADQGPEKVEENIVTMLKEFDLSEVKAIGIGSPGPVDKKNKVITMATNIKGFENYPLVKHLEEIFNKEVFIDNDANVAGLAEAVLGAGKGKDVVYYLTHSTGIGGALIINGHTYGGAHGYAGEVANIIIDPYIEKKNHLAAGAVENEASGTALFKKANQMGLKDTGALFEAYSQGNEKAKEVIELMAKQFAIMMNNIAMVADPDIFVIGGGVAEHAHQYYFDLVSKYYNQYVQEGIRDIPIVLASLDKPGVLGAAMLAAAES